MTTEWPSDDYVAERVAELLFDQNYGHYWEYQDWDTQAAYLRIALDAIAEADRYESIRENGRHQDAPCPADGHSCGCATWSMFYKTCSSRAKTKKSPPE